MRISEFNRDSSRSPVKDKENYYGCSSLDLERVRAMVLRNEQTLNEMRKEIKQKVNKTEFLSALGSKVSLSDLTTLSLDFSERKNPSQAYLQVIEEKVKIEVRNNLQNMELEHGKCNERLQQELQKIRSQLSRIESLYKRGEAEHLKQLRQSDHNLLHTLQKKADRSELDKMMHLSSLLAIQFQLIKKRFGTFQVDYNMIWKEISNLYENHESLRSVFQTERKESSENTRQKQLQVLLATGKNNCTAKLFGEKEEATRTMDVNETEQTIVQFHQKIQQVQHTQNDLSFTISNFSDRLSLLQKDYESWLECAKDITRLKREYEDSKIEMGIIENENRRLKEEIKQMVRQQCKTETKQVGKGISCEIQQACEEITNKMLQLFSQCTKSNETDVLKNTISNIEEGMVNRVTLLQDNCKKRMETLSIRQEQTEDKLRLISKELGNRLRIDDFEQAKQQLVTAEASQMHLKKTQNMLKKEINEFKESQKLVNEVVCSQTILARWIWVSGQVKGGNLISWDKESINTLPENFIYNQSDLTFKIASSGIYKIEMGFYAKKKPAIQIIINGKTIVSAVNSSSYVVHHSSGKLKDIINSEVAGLTYYDYYTLQENTRLAISYSGEVGHGFFGIQRL